MSDGVAKSRIVTAESTVSVIDRETETPVSFGYPLC